MQNIGAGAGVVGAGANADNADGEPILEVQGVDGGNNQDHILNRIYDDPLDLEFLEAEIYDDDFFEIWNDISKKYVNFVCLKT